MVSLYIFVYSARLYYRAGVIMKKQANDGRSLRPNLTSAGVRKSMIGGSLGCAIAALALAPFAAQADPLDPTFVNQWMAMATATQAAQPHWMTPLVTVTPRLEQELRWDFYDQQNGTGSQGNGQHIYNYGGPGGMRAEFIPSTNTELILAAPPVANAWGPKGTAQGMGDWPAFLVKYRFAAANEENGNYIVTAFFQMSDPSGTGAGISNNVLVAAPTLAFGKGWGDFDFIMTLSQQYPVASIGTPPKTGTTVGNFGDPFLWNTTFQYHFLQYFWPELEVNYTYWPNGTHSGLSQVLLTPGIIFGRFPLGPPRQNLILGVGYQFAVTNNPVVQNNVVATVRVTF
jgi:hypothetical protein